jgi:hypothetical protein
MQLSIFHEILSIYSSDSQYDTLDNEKWEIHPFISYEHQA